MRTIQSEWYNRMLLECYGQRHLPFFLTLTYSSANYLDNMNHALKESQKYFKRLRRYGHDIRYFMAIERGTRGNRLHNHAIVWSKSLSQYDYGERWRILYQRWGNGAVDCSQVRSPAALRYTAKYITKNIENLSEISDVKDVKTILPNGKCILKGMQYTWSNRPPLGNEGLLRWREIILHRNKWVKYSIFNLPSGVFKMIYRGKQYPVYIPRANYVKLCKDLNINLQMRHDMSWLENDDLILNLI